MKDYQKLISHFEKISRFKHLASICGWDQAAVMPSGGNQARSESMAELSVHIHHLLTDPQLGEWFTNVNFEELSSIEAASFIEMKRHWHQATVLPENSLKQNH